MTAHRITSTAHPMRSYAPIQPMEREQAQFWSLRKRASVSMKEWMGRHTQP